MSRITSYDDYRKSLAFIFAKKFHCDIEDVTDNDINFIEKYMFDSPSLDFNEYCKIITIVDDIEFSWKEEGF